MEIKQQSYSIVWLYYNNNNRFLSMQKTLDSFNKFGYEKRDFEIVIVFDAKNTKPDIEQAVAEIVGRGFDLKYYVCTELKFNSGYMSNIGTAMATKANLIVTCPEIVFKNDILAGLDAYDFENTYVFCACEDVDDNFNHIRWYQHSVHRNALINFCACTCKYNFLKSGMFDERLCYGISYTDNAHQACMKRAGVISVTNDDLISMHIDHTRGPEHDIGGKNRELFVKYYGSTGV
jgi:hypothetical protein